MAKCKILKTGETDINSTDIWRFCIHSDYPTQKIYASGQTTLTIPADSTSGVKTISHSLGYAPIVMAMFEIDGSRYVKVFGETKVDITAQAMQSFAVDTVADSIISKADYVTGSARKDSYVSINDIIQFQSSPGNSGVLPRPLQTNTNYYVKSIPNRQYFNISASLGGSKLNITDGGGTYGDIFKNITNPRIVSMPGTYKVKSTSTTISFEFNPAISTEKFGADKNINVYYIILYDQI